MTLKKIFNLHEADEVSDGIPQTIPNPKQQGKLNKLFTGRPQAGAGPTSDGIPLPVGGGDGMPKNPGFSTPGMDPLIGDPVAMGATTPVDYGSKTVPNPRPNPGGAGAPPRPAGSFSRAPNAPAEDEPLPDLPLESSIKTLYGIHTTEAQVKSIRGPARLVELYGIDEMPRPKGSIGAETMAFLKWAKEQGGREWTAREAFKVWRAAGGQRNNPNDNAAYQSFQTTLRKYIDPRGRGTPDQPLVNTVKGVRGSRSQAGIYVWGGVRPSKTVAAKPMPGTTPYDDMELGPAGNGAEPEPDAEMPDDTGTEAEPVQTDQEPESDVADEPETSDEYDWIPDADPETDVGRAMIELQQDDEEKLQELLAACAEAETVMQAAQSVFSIYGRKNNRSAMAMKIAKSAAANRGLPDPDGLL